MTPNADAARDEWLGIANAGRVNPVPVTFPLRIIEIGDRGYDIKVTIDMFEMYLQELLDGDHDIPEHMRVTQSRLYLLEHGHSIPSTTMLHCVNSGRHIDCGTWFEKYGFAVDMVNWRNLAAEQQQHTLHENNEMAHYGINNPYMHSIDDDDDDTETTRSMTLSPTSVTELSDITDTDWDPLPIDPELEQLDLDFMERWINDLTE